MRRKRRRSGEEVELNLAAMLDMAFQLLAFFILTFRPSPVEGQVRLHLPPPRPTTVLPQGKSPGQDLNDVNPVQGLNTIVVSVFSTPDGQIQGLALGETQLANVDALGRQLKATFSDPALAFDQILIQVGSQLSYQALMDVVDVCTQTTLPNGEKLTKLGFAEIVTK
jgi:biopolymer transport protein ExbD